MRRSASDRVLAGVCGGLGEALGVDAVLLRLAFVLAAAAGGVGVVLYLAVAFLLPGPARDEPGRAHREQEALAVLALLGAGMVALERSGLLVPIGVLGPVALLLCGVALIWRRASGVAVTGPDGPGWARPAALEVLAMAAGVALVIGGAYAFLAASGDIAAGAYAAFTAAAVAGGIGLLVAPSLRRARSVAQAERGERIRAEERASIAGRLHDSVLQTLALIQRTDDPRRSQMLARGQERELRAWLYGGEDPEAPDTFAAALRHVAADVEDRYGIAVELVQPSDAALDAGLDALVAAAREAMTNAAKHAGVDRVSVLARVVDGEASVFVRDRGEGFVRTAVPADRRGLRDSIELRMARHGGRATILSTPGAGTEIELSLPRDPSV